MSRLALTALLLILVATRVFMFAIMPLANEDAYITFRYAQNIAAGNGAVYNLGERVMGYTSPLWTFAVAGGCAMGIDPVVWARLLSLGCDIGTLLVVRRIMGVIPGNVFGFFFAGWAYFAALSASGMEMSALLFLAALAAWRRSWWALFLLAVTRPEGLMMSAILAVWCRPRTRIIAAVATVSVMAALALYYGSAVPNSVTAKAAAYGRPGLLAAKQWWAWTFPYNAMPQEHLFTVAISAVLAMGLATGVPFLWATRRSAAAALAAAGLVVWATYAVVGVAYFWWYMAVPIFAAGFVASWGLARLKLPRAAHVALASCIAISFVPSTKSFLLRNGQDSLFRTIGEDIRDRSSPLSRIALEPIGHIGYVTNMRVDDMVGLVAPLDRSSPGWLGRMLRERKPDWILVRVGEVRGRAFAGGVSPFLSTDDIANTLSGYRAVKVYGTSRRSGAAGDADLALFEAKGDQP